jgi:hypothetical protein
MCGGGERKDGCSVIFVRKDGVLTDRDVDRVADKVLARLGVDEAIRSARESFNESVKLTDERMREIAGAKSFNSMWLKACPFCSSGAEFFKHADGLYRIRCVNIACGATIDGWSKTESAVEAWNKRA